jgi:hypothetical protein
MMDTLRVSLASALVLGLSIASGAWAVDDGQTKPRLSAQSVATNTTVDIIPLTSGSGNIKGFQCTTTAPMTTRLHFYVDGAPAQTLDPGLVLIYVNADGSSSSAVIPMNVRFQSSIRVALQKSSLSAGSVWCLVTWGLD